MSIFETIQNAIFSHPSALAAAPAHTVAAPPPTGAVGATPAGAAASTLPKVDAKTGMLTTPAAPAGTPTPQPVDVEAALESLVRKSGQQLSWRTSIVDLMKVVGLDPSLHNRKDLAHELGYTGNTTDSASMNTWLHRQVMNKLEENGGKLPASLRT